MKPIAMKCTPKQWESIKHHFDGWDATLVKFLPHQEYLVNNYSDAYKKLGTVVYPCLHRREIFGQWDADIFLEYCDIKPEFVLPEKWAVKITDENRKTLHNWAKSQPGYDDIWDRWWCVNDRGEFLSGTDVAKDGSYGIGDDFMNSNHPDTQIITFEQFQQHVLKQKTHMKLTVHVSEVLKIHEMACPEWKSRIADYLKRINVNQNITFSEQEIRGMFEAATPKQKPVLESIFGSLSKPIEWDKIKTGSKVMIKYAELNCGNPTVDYSQPVDVVFYKTPYGINYRGKFFLAGRYHPSYITFNQNGNFILYASDENTDCIVEVLEY
jgi:hypothetical protein